MAVRHQSAALSVLVDAHYQRAQKIFCKVTADDHYKAYLDGAFMGEGPAAAYHTKYYYNVLELGTFAAGEHVLALHLTSASVQISL